MKGAIMENAFFRFMCAMDLDEFNVIRDSTIGASLAYADILQLFIIRHKGKMTISELADYMRLSRPAVTQKVNELVKKGLITKTQSKQDKRIFNLSLSDKVTENCREPKMDTVLNAVDKKFSEGDKAIFAKILNFMADYVSEGQVPIDDKKNSN